MMQFHIIEILYFSDKTGWGRIHVNDRADADAIIKILRDQTEGSNYRYRIIQGIDRINGETHYF